MGDAGEGLVDAESRIQERLEELARERRDAAREPSGNPQAAQEAESLKLARTELMRQLSATTDERRRTSLTQAIEEIDRRLQGLGA